MFTLTPSPPLYFSCSSVVGFNFDAQHRAADAVSLLMRLTPAIATRIQANGQRTKVSADALTPGDRVVVMMGEAVPVDALIDR